jgi:hypothetical protein
MYPPDEIPGYPREQLMDELLHEHESGGPRLPDGGRAQGPDLTPARRFPGE